jgi:glycosyltransferase involved in cell wall biosynthesis
LKAEVEFSRLRIPLAKPVFEGEIEKAAVDAPRNERFVSGESVGKFEERDTLGKTLAASLSIGVVIPTLNEEMNIVDVLTRLRKLGYTNILVMDGHSDDRTVEVAGSFGARVILQNGIGKGNAIREVFDNEYVDADILVLMDADGSMSPEEIPNLIEAMKSDVCVVKGSRFMKGGHTHDMSLLRKFGNFLFLTVVNLLWGTDYTDLCYGFAAFRKDSIREITPRLRSLNFEIETELFIETKKMGLKTIEVPSTEYRRAHGKSNLNAFMDGFRILNVIVRKALRE